jgi:hypothetical protein
MTQRSRVSELNKAENRLKIIEKISKYREQKIKKEFEKLEEELKQDEQRQKDAQLREVKMRKYHEVQKKKLEDF